MVIRAQKNIYDQEIYIVGILFEMSKFCKMSFFKK